MHPEVVVSSKPEIAAARHFDDEPSGVVTFTLLGPVEVRKGGQDYAPTAPKMLQLLALLLMRPGKIVQIDSIIEELWANDPPRSVRTTMQTYVYQLRKCIEHNGLATDGEELLVTRTPGYAFKIDPAQVDVFAFELRCRQGRQLLDEGRFDQAAAAFRAALSLWSGAPMANVNCGSVLSAYAVELQEQRRNAQHLRIQSEIEGGMHRDLIGELRSLVTSNPLDEGLHGQLMRVLGRSGRRSDAMATYRQLRARLNNELGVDPCDELQSLHHQLLSAKEHSP
ncbi:DNA-binding transcriptional activator of the SARP family [Amycolatopsis marina]|uniref:DNA-binding transcriptional activator of the SARP family n=1 Tax=Amycolatopsis marina TaxID=490629 RepID=A0A1I0ZM20_9PSEU|nr:AfsR/SARP family transcriptional regulator [Amycolatopsis marina]SFB25243.1 DNA-binding transcriptional activator of the SARP family [Amycolatopsis marina]